jgi:hypothetical protein
MHHMVFQERDWPLGTGRRSRTGRAMKIFLLLPCNSPAGGFTSSEGREPLEPKPFQDTLLTSVSKTLGGTIALQNRLQDDTDRSDPLAGCPADAGLRRSRLLVEPVGTVPAPGDAAHPWDGVPTGVVSHAVRGSDMRFAVALDTAMARRPDAMTTRRFVASTASLRGRRRQPSGRDEPPSSPSG